MEVVEVRPEITSLINTVSREQGFRDYVISDVQTNQKGEGYLGEIFMATVKDKDGDRRLDMVIKAAFTNEQVRALIPIRMAFENEIFFYQDLHAVFTRMERERDIRHYPAMVPKCLKVDVQESQEVLVLENMKSVGFEVFDKKLVLDRDHIELIFRTYARLHAYSFALKDQNAEEYSGIVGNLHNVWGEFMKEKLFPDYLAQMSKLTESCLVPGEDDKLIKEFKKYEGHNIANIFNSIITDDVDYSVILHGDCWSNNMLFRYEDDGKRRRPTEIRLIDWQIINVGSPVWDLSYCLYSGASEAVLDNINDYLAIYHESFSTFLRELGSDPDKLFPFSALKDHWKRYSKFGMIMSLGILRMKLTHTEDVIDFKDGFEEDEMMSMLAASKYNEEDFFKRVKGMLWHMLEIGAL